MDLGADSMGHGKPVEDRVSNNTMNYNVSI